MGRELIGTYQTVEFYGYEMSKEITGGVIMFFFNRNQINNAVEEWRNMADAVLVDVREADEFKVGHIPGAINVPLSEIHTICIPKDKQVLVYCLRGTRSRQAVGKMKKMGYTKVKSIGGIVCYKGQIEK